MAPVSLLSKAPDDGHVDHALRQLHNGSFNTLLYGSEFDSGPIDATDGTRVMFDMELLKSDGLALTNMALTRSNAFLKVVQPLGNNTTLTVAAMYNNLHQDISLGATAAQIATLGPNWGLSADPANQNYFGYNSDRISTDFEYMDLESGIAGDGWSTGLNVKALHFCLFPSRAERRGSQRWNFPTAPASATIRASGTCSRRSKGTYLLNERD